VTIFKDLTVLELGRVPPMEVPGLVLASFGARVIKIDAPGDSALSEEERDTIMRAPTNRGIEILLSIE